MRGGSPSRLAAGGGGPAGRRRAPGCDAGALARNLALARRLGISATPTIVFPSGDRVVATLPAPETERRLAGTALALGR